MIRHCLIRERELRQWIEQVERMVDDRILKVAGKYKATKKKVTLVYWRRDGLAKQMKPDRTAVSYSLWRP